MDSKQIFLTAALSGLAFVATASDSKGKPMEKAHASSPAVSVIEGRCHGINTCHTATNSCQGKGWVKTTEKECKEKKGTFKLEEK
jgi:hypothetical protein